MVNFMEDVLKKVLKLCKNCGHYKACLMQTPQSDNIMGFGVARGLRIGDAIFNAKIVDDTVPRKDMVYVNDCKLHTEYVDFEPVGKG